MASRIRVCSSKEEAERMHQAGLLLTYYRSGWAGKDSDLWRNAGYALSRYGEGSDWPPEDFGYLVDEDEEDVSY